MPPGRRKQPFSGKQKKAQLQAKRERKHKSSLSRDDNDEYCDKIIVVKSDAESPSEQPVLSQSCASFNGSDARRPVGLQFTSEFDSVSSEGPSKGRYSLRFLKESKDDVEEQKRLSATPIQLISLKSDRVIPVESVYPSNLHLDLPIRPSWSYDMNTDELDRREKNAFTTYLRTVTTPLAADTPAPHASDIGYLELNLESWRQLWRVLEMSDLLLLVADIRFAVLHFPPSLYDYVTGKCKKQFILVLNKCDLVPETLVASMRAYLISKFPLLHIVVFTSFPVAKEERPEEDGDGEVKQLGGAAGKLRRKKKRSVAKGPQELFDVCKELFGTQVDFSDWQHHLNKLLGIDDAAELICDDVGEISKSMERNRISDAPHHKPVAHAHCESSQFQHPSAAAAAGLSQRKTLTDGVLTIGTLGSFEGFPNVGKSSLINGLCGRIAVSTSRTPGHTKYFQTIFLTHNICIADCPGLVFPSIVAKPLQILSGIFPVAQVRVPYTAIRYLAERCNLALLLGIRCESEAPSALEICEAWALKRGFMTERAGRPDIYRAGNHLLRCVVEGRLSFYLFPPLSEQATQQSQPIEDESDGREIVSSDEESEDDEDNVESDSEHDEGDAVSSNPFDLLADADS